MKTVLICLFILGFLISRGLGIVCLFGLLALGALGACILIYCLIRACIEFKRAIDIYR
jgi:hypothetical protein